MAEIVRPKNTLENLQKYNSKVPPTGDFATLKSVTPLMSYVDHFYPSGMFANKYDKMVKIAQSFGDPNQEAQIAPNLRAESQSTQNAIRSIVNKVTNYTDNNDLTTMIREAIRMNFVTAAEVVTNTNSAEAHVEPQLDGVNSSSIVKVLASLDSIELLDNQMSKFKSGTLNDITAVLSVISQSAPQLSGAVLDLINLVESYFQLAGIVKELVAAAKNNEQPATSSVGTGIVQNMSGIIDMVNSQNTKMSALQINQTINDITEMMANNSVVNVNGQQVLSVNKEAIRLILNTYATDDDLMDLQSLANGSDMIRNTADMYNTIIAFHNAVPTQNAEYMNPNPWYQLMLLSVARLQAQAIVGQADIQQITAQVYNEISLYAKIQIEGNVTNIENALRSDINMGTKLSTLVIGNVLGDSTLMNFANAYLGVGMNGICKLSPDVVVSSMRATNSAFSLSRMTARDIENYLGLSGIGSNIIANQDTKNEIIGALCSIYKTINY